MTIPTGNEESHRGKAPKCDKCTFYHSGPCRTVICSRCRKNGHFARNCKMSLEPPSRPTRSQLLRPRPLQQRPQLPAQQVTYPLACYGCGSTERFLRNCPQLAQPTAERNVQGQASTSTAARGLVFIIGSSDAR
ncbi:putative transcription factor interactor and regulator CCHC(Zn) family [Helianthus annuus]|nr:putative transcription factor interactor and regulator CCHC(Zn) family [Helianthus annuus]